MKRLIVLLNIVLLTLLAYTAVDLFYAVASNRLVGVRQTGFSEEEKAQLAGRNIPPFNAYEAISRRNLFKTGGPDVGQAKEPDIEGLDKTNLELRLWGTVIGGEGETYAVIERTDQNRQMLYKEGDTVAAQATVKFIMRDKVVLTVEGKDEVLEMEQKGDQGMAVPRSRYIPSRTDSEDSSSSGGNLEIVLQRGEINRATSNINELMTQALIAPHFERGRSSSAGLSISQIQNSSIFRKMGLQNGDIIVGVNGREIHSVDDALSLYRNLKNQDRVSLKIRRRGQIKQFQYAIE